MGSQGRRPYAPVGVTIAEIPQISLLGMNGGVVMLMLYNLGRTGDYCVGHDCLE